MKNTQPVFRLRELIYKKFGEEKFAIACDIVARWVRYDTKFSQWHADTVLHMCNAVENEEFPISLDEAESLRHLFHLESVLDLFTDPSEGYEPQPITFIAKNFAA
jgi:hypothetical protein